MDMRVLSNYFYVILLDPSSFLFAVIETGKDSKFHYTDLGFYCCIGFVEDSPTNVALDLVTYHS